MKTDRRGAIIILEGADCSGKTTLALSIGAHVLETGGDFLYLHGSPWPGTVEREHMRMEAIATAGALYYGQVVVLDHFWIAEQVYGMTYRKAPAYDPTQLDSRMRTLGAMLVLCVPMNRILQVKRHRDRHAAGKEHFSDASDVIRRYADLQSGHANCDDASYVGYLTRLGAFSLRADVQPYDIDDVQSVPSVAARFVARARDMGEMA